MRQIPIGICVLHASLLAWLSAAQAPVYDEPAHLAAGISHWQFGRFDLYSANPPLVRMCAAIPVLLARPETEWAQWSDAPGTRHEFPVGATFVRVNGERTFHLFALARWACIPFSLLGAGICYRWARELYGPAAGTTALTLWCFSPEILANGSLITPDLGAAAFGVLAAYCFRRFLVQPGLATAYSAGLTLGLALLAKLTWVFLFLLWPMIWIGWRLLDRGRSGASTSWRREGGLLAGVLAMGLLVVNVGYAFNGTGTRLGDFEFVSRRLAGPRSDWDSPRSGNVYQATPLAIIPVLLPKDYVLGLDIVKADIEGGRQVFLGGEFRSDGWWHYYLYAAVVKIPLGTWLVGLMAVWLAMTRCIGRLPARENLFLVAMPVFLLVLLSMNPGINGYFRYALPMFPFAFIWMSRAMQAFSVRAWPAASAVALGMAWTIVGSLWHLPYSGSYFNELAGGPRNGHAHLLSSNIDWGQDLLHLRDWLRRHPEVRPLGLAFFGGFDPAAAGIEYHLPPVGPSRLPNGAFDVSSRGPSQYGPQPGWHAISVHILRGTPAWPFNGRGRREFVPFQAYAYFLEFEPVAMAGYSIYVYHITLEDANRVRQAMGLPLLGAPDA
ncbi:MAG: glycosyltransferase family 39 protein [Planctomyces sp.]|nr:glycosyltransferase family 39 protein [Planctomyces sp.]